MGEGQRITVVVRILSRALSSHQMDLGTMMPLQFELLGGYRTAEKVRGVAR